MCLRWEAFPAGLGFPVEELGSVSQLESIYQLGRVSQLASISQLGSVSHLESVSFLGSISQLGSVSQFKGGKMLPNWETFLLKKFPNIRDIRRG